MADITGKTVYVLGAGASAHTGAPLLRDFLVTARLLLESRPGLVQRESFERVFKWTDGLRGSSYYVDLDLDNLEHVFSLADMSKQLDLENGKQIFSDIQHMLMETLDHACTAVWKQDHFDPDAIYSRFVRRLRDMNIARAERAGNETEWDPLITFNYDVMLDYAMRYNNLGPEYCLGPSQVRPQSEDFFRVLKLHGSANWGSCAQCGFTPQVVPAAVIPSGKQILPPGDGESLPFRMATHVLKAASCRECRKRNVLVPLVIPPTWSKVVGDNPIASVWASSVNEIRTAFQIIVIGYSLPQTDTFLQYLMALGLARNSSLHRVVVVNPDGSAELRSRYEMVFSRSLKDRGRLIFFDEDFEHFVASKRLSEIGSCI